MAWYFLAMNRSVVTKACTEKLDFASKYYFLNLLMQTCYQFKKINSRLKLIKKDGEQDHENLQKMVFDFGKLPETDRSSGKKREIRARSSSASV
jgi:hypothetical protein